MAASAPAPLRPLGDIERFCSSRHHMSIYRSVVITCRYQFTSPLTTAHLYSALTIVIRAHPMLRVGILGENTNTPTFSHVSEVDLRKHADFRSPVDSASVAEYEDEVARMQGWRHNQLFSNIETQPPWQVIVLQPPAGLLDGHVYDLVLGFHHSIADGTGGKLFHEGLLDALNQAPSQETPHMLSFPTPPKLPEASEHVMDYTTTIGFRLSNLWTSMAPSWLQRAKPRIWHGRNIDYSLPYITRVLPIDVPSEQLSSLLKACRAHKTSLTGLVHALALASLSLRLPEDQAPAFASSSPINARPYLSARADPDFLHTIRVLICTSVHAHPASTVSEFRSPAADIDALIWSNASRVKDELVERTSSLPANELLALSLDVVDWFDYWRKKEGQARDDSWEVSNLGVFKSNTASQDASAAITRILFTNAAMVAGPAIGLGVGSVAGGGLTIAVSWQEKAVPDIIIQALRNDLATFLLRFHQAGKFST